MNSLPLDLSSFSKALHSVCRSAFQDLLGRHADDGVYCAALFAADPRNLIGPIVLTARGCDEAIRRAREASPRDPSADELVGELRWNPEASPHHGEGFHHFDVLRPHLDAIAARFDALDDGTEDGQDAVDELAMKVDREVCNVLRALDREGIFGKKKERDGIVVTVFMEGCDDTSTIFAERLNPKRVSERFDQEVLGI
jgi:hypothetical protein